MGGFYDGRVAFAAEYVAGQAGGEFLVELFGVTHASAQDDDVRVDYVDDGSQASGQVFQVLVQGFGGLRVAMPGMFNNGMGGQLLAGAQFVGE